MRRCETTRRRFEETSDRSGQIVALVAIARVCRKLGSCRPDPLALTEKALGIFEDTRGTLLREDHRLSYGSLSQELFDLRIDLLWEAGDPGGAFQAAELARARALRDRLRLVGAEAGHGMTDGQLQALRALRRRIDAKELQRRKAEARGGLDPAARAAFERQLDELLGKLNAEESEIGRHHPAFRELMRAEPLSLETVQGLLGGETVLLEYRLGESRSYLWVVTADEAAELELPPRAEIESWVQEARGALTLPEPGPRSGLQDPALAELAGRILPEEVVPLLAGRRLAIVADGALETIPFAALPDPAGPHPLVAGHQIVHLPSASVWRELRDRPMTRPTPSAGAGRVAVVADPAYGPDFPPLPFTRQEAEAILRAMPGGCALYGAEASKAAVLGHAKNRCGDLREYRYIHFAVHGEVHPRQPALSFLALSQRDAEGGEIDGPLFAHQLFDLDLPAELVVLSGCDTGLGPRIPGEGLVSGLARGFLYAGSRRVAVSLWRISDAKTPELMRRFYDGLGRGRDPAESLQLAQQELWQDGQHPYYWAGFVLQGDWAAASAAP